MLLSALLHAAILLMLLLPSLVARELDLPLTEGAGGPGPAGGGGGGNRGAGGERLQPERLKFLQVAAPLPVPKLPVPTPPKPEPELVKPEPAPVAAVVEPVVAPTIPIAGTGGGTGTDGSGGNGPGTGGGIGSGVGTGRGTANGPGTGGGYGDTDPPRVTNLALLPIPVPHKVRPYRMVAWFDVDEQGNAKLIAFNPSKDSGYNRKIRDMLAEVRFKPAMRGGTPVRDTVSIVAEAPR